MTNHNPAPQQSTRSIVRIPLSEIQPGPLSMRAAMDPAELAELALSLSRVGQFNAINVTRSESGYELIMGHRRCAAAQLNGWTHIDAIIEQRDDPSLWSMAWAENHARAPVTATDQADWLDKMRSSNGWTQQQLSAVTGMSESQISDILAILRYPEPLREALDAGAISHGVARAYNRIDDRAVMVYYLAQACEYGCTARAAEDHVRNWRLSTMSPPEGDADTDAAQLPAPAPPTYANTCAACLTTSPAPLTIVAVCLHCRELIINPPGPNG